MQKIFLSLFTLASAMHLAAQNGADSMANIRRSQYNLQKAQQNQYLEQTNSQTIHYNEKIDTSKLEKKTIRQEIDLPKALDVLIDMGGEVVITTWNENKIKLETTVLFEGPSELTDTQWMDKLGINMKVFGSTVKVKSKPNNGFRYLNSNGTITLTSASPVFSNIGTFSNGLKVSYQAVMLYIPAESLLEITSNYGRLKINDNIKTLSLNNTDGEITFANIEKLKLRGNRGSFNGGVIANADIELSHGRFSIKQIDKGELTSTYSTIEIESIKDVKLNSSSDEMEIDEAGSLYGIKKYGSLRINQLTGKLDLEGVNSDINLRHVRPSAQLVKITNRNADLRLPVNDLSHFLVDIRGSYNKIYSFFSDKATVDTLTAKEIESLKSATNMVASGNNAISITGGGTVTQSYKLSQSASSEKVFNITVSDYSSGGGGGRSNPYLKYVAKVGDGSSQLHYQIVCISCVIDFK
jgi:hypothetical protein